jgi:hypothetical protein
MVKNHFPPDDRIPLFLSNLAEEPKQSGIWKVVSSEVFRKTVLLFAGAAVVFAVVSVGNVILFASVTASEVGTPMVQSTASSEASPRTPPGDELLAAFKSVLENKAEVDQPRAQALLNQFQAWAAEEDTQAQVRPPEPVQGVQAPSVQKARALPLPKPRPIQAARAQDLSQNAHGPVRSFSWHN